MDVKCHFCPEAASLHLIDQFSLWACPAHHFMLDVLLQEFRPDMSPEWQLIIDYVRRYLRDLQGDTTG